MLELRVAGCTPREPRGEYLEGGRWLEIERLRGG